MAYGVSLSRCAEARVTNGAGSQSLQGWPDTLGHPLSPNGELNEWTFRSFDVQSVRLIA
jgi:hypothetical protein